ncbi:MAG: hypothetical protein IT353_17670 [Gemmatimonadaceae bacterium]|nr:hypothetical protein [Gemmatimonadaceae bacterium]
MSRTALLIALLAAQPLRAQVAQTRARERALWGAAESKPEVLFLGLFHFEGEKVDVETTPANLLPDMLSATRQAELRALRARIVAWRPTKVVVEWPASDQGELDSVFQVYKGNPAKFANNPDERVQLAFPVALALGHKTVYAADAANPQIRTALNDSARVAKYDEQRIEGEEKWDARYDSLEALHDTLRTRVSLADYLLYLNSDDSQAKAVGRWLVQTKRGTNTEPVGADGFITRYFLRNVRIYSNVQRIVDSPTDRVIIMYGNTHGYFLRELFRASPEFRLRDASVVLGPRPR